MLLSSLLVFTSLVENMDDRSRDAILHVVHLLTRFPPAVRAVYAIMKGKVPTPCERTALSQSIYEVLQDFIPRKLINSDNRRILEGSRLFFGFVLEKAKDIRLQNVAQLPYMSSLQIHDLRDPVTLESIATPVLTGQGVVESGHYKAFQEGGVLSWINVDTKLSKMTLEKRMRRIYSLGGGAIPHITTLDETVFNTSAYGSAQWAEDLQLGEGPELEDLSKFCSRNGLSVIPPGVLGSFNPKTLTLDREGLLAVYLTKPKSVEDKDFTFYRAMRGKEKVDPSSINHVLIPILERRQHDGTSIFDGFAKAYQKKPREPDEIVRICVDCSQNMLKSVASTGSDYGDGHNVIIARKTHKADSDEGYISEQSRSDDQNDGNNSSDSEGLGSDSTGLDPVSALESLKGM